MTNALRSELLKLRTIRSWWFAVAAVAATTAITLAWNIWQASIFMQPFEDYLRQAYTQPRETLTDEQVAIMAEIYGRQSDPDRIVANVYTSGQYLGLLVAALIAILVVTNEYHHRTAAATFLMNPRRAHVAVAKLVAGIVVAASLWLTSTVISTVGGAVFFVSRDADVRLGDGTVLGALALNLAAFVVWAVFGFGIGALMRNQMAATATVVALYFVTSVVVTLVFQALHDFVLEEDWVLRAQVLVPAVASQILTTPGKVFPQAPEQWVGAVVLLGYGAVFGLFGARKMARRDISY